MPPDSNRVFACFYNPDGAGNHFICDPYYRPQTMVIQGLNAPMIDLLSMSCTNSLLSIGYTQMGASLFPFFVNNFTIGSAPPAGHPSTIFFKHIQSNSIYRNIY